VTRSPEFFSQARRRSLLLIAIRPRNSTIRCLSLYFSNSPALPFTMVAPVPAQITKLRLRLSATAPRRALLSTHYPLPTFSLPPSSISTSCFAVPARPNSRLFILLWTLCRCQKRQLLCNQSNPNSFAKTPGVGDTHTNPPFRISNIQTLSRLASQSLRRLCALRVSALTFAVDFVRPLFSYPYELLFSQPLCFAIHLNCPGVWGSYLPLPTLRSLCLCGKSRPASYNRAAQLGGEGS
jgi:hypothetical protein